MRRLPHPIPYQGSKRLLAPTILGSIQGQYHRLIEPFAGSAALTLAAASQRFTAHYWVNDSLTALVGIWESILQTPKQLADEYERIWTAQLTNPASFYIGIRDAYNEQPDPAKLLYLLARCVKNAVRFNRDGQFNQSPDHRRLGMHPQRMRESILGASSLLANKTRTSSCDYSEVLAEATAGDLVYMDPPYQGTSIGRDRRYHAPLDVERFIEQLDRLNSRRVSYIVSFDGRCGTRAYGADLPSELKLKKVEIEIGRSSQATLVGRSELTVESLYYSPTLATSIAAVCALRDHQVGLPL